MTVGKFALADYRSGYPWRSAHVVSCIEARHRIGSNGPGMERPATRDKEIDKRIRRNDEARWKPASDESDPMPVQFRVRRHGNGNGLPASEPENKETIPHHVLSERS
jgi:hypothetical protein